MKNKRQEKIVSLITRYEIETQEELIGMLYKELGFPSSLSTAQAFRSFDTSLINHCSSYSYFP